MRLVLLFMFAARLSLAQFTYVLDQEVPVIHTADTLKFPWAGGLNATQINTIDLNGDDNDDLVVFDRMADRVLTFLNVGNNYVYAPEFEVLFPNDMEGFMLLRDYNCDGRKDIFTKDLLGIKVFKNVTTQGGPLDWEQVLFYTGFPGSKSEVVLTLGFSGKINLQLQPDDLPALVDVDGDGDLDIMNVKFVGTNTIEFHKNFSMERYGVCDSLDLERMTQTWGNVEDCECGVFAFGTPCATGGRIKHAGGKSLLAIDLDNDQDMDILYSESECNSVYQLTNVGDTDNPLVTSAALFPPGAPISIFPFPAVYYEDVDFDGRKDIIASPNIFGREFFQTDLNQSVWFYKNTGTQELPVFTFQQRNFLQQEMIDVGDNAAPAFFDADADGDLEMFIGNYADGGRASIYYYENTGTRTDPLYTLNTNDLLGISFFGFTNIKPQFADMNGDAKVDLVFTASNSFGVSTNLYYLPNTSSVGLNFTGQQLQTVNFPIFAGENIRVANINDDALPDLLVGRQNGSVQYWQNTGTPATPSFTLANPAFLGLGASVLRQNPAVDVGDLNADGMLDLVMGDQNGIITIFDNFKEATGVIPGNTNIIYNPIQQAYTTQNLGGRLWPTVANVYNTNKPAIVVGNTLGGLHLLKHDESAPLPETPQVVIYPNPVIKEQTSIINISVDRPTIARLIAVTGQELGEPLFFQGQQLYQYNIEGLSPGMYILQFYIDGKSYSRRFIVQ